MKALILAGGKGTRLHPTTKIYNKHLIHVYDMPMIMYAIKNLKESGITDIILSLSKDKPELFIEYLQDGSEFGVNLTYIVQNDSKGIAYAINQAKHLLENEGKFMVYLADNYFHKNLSNYVDCFENMDNDDSLILVQKSSHPERYGVAYISNDKLTRAVEKPKENQIGRFSGRDIILGVYFFSSNFFKVFNDTRPSQRGEYEVTDMLNLLIPNVYCAPYKETWYDLGTPDDIVKCSYWLMNRKTEQTIIDR